jgi:hypothetical protein
MLIILNCEATVKQIQLTQGQVALVDDDDFDRLSKFKWHAWWNKHTRSFYARRGVYDSTTGQTRVIRMNREVLDARPDELVDHRNHDTLDNRKENLRPCNKSQNGANRRGLQSNNTSGYQGVTRYARDGRWRAQLKINNKMLHLGYFSSKHEAARAYNEAAIKYHGDFARLNKIDDDLAIAV